MKNHILWDCHMHSSFSSDSQTPMEQMIRRAIALGMDGITFTEHWDPDYPVLPGGCDFSLDLPAYLDSFSRLKSQYSSRIEIRFGIELGLQPHLAPRFEKLLKEYPFDFVIGSSHVVHQADPYYPPFFQNREESEAYREYFVSILENIKNFSQMDVYGHIDYVVRYGPNQNRFYSYEKYADILDAILHALVEKGIGLELNTGGYHYGLQNPNPCPEVIRRYKELGGEIVTIGADAHSPDKIGYSFDLASQVLRDCGFAYYTVFQNRKPKFLKL